MKHSTDPRQNWLFDPTMARFSPMAKKRLTEGWAGVFRTCILELMPVCEVGMRFAERMGRPTKELYSICGLVMLMDFNNWTAQKAADAYIFDGQVQFALNLGQDQQSMCTRTVERYRKIFREDELGQKFLDRMTGSLVKLLDLEVRTLRLDSTHVFSDMASMGRTKLMRTAVRRFLVQLKRHDAKGYEALPEKLQKRYDKDAWDFGKTKAGKKGPTALEVAADMQTLIDAFADNEKITRRTSFKAMVRIFEEQCEVAEDKIKIRKNAGCETMQNPSDPEATHDPHKGSGYKVQTGETCDKENETQLIVAATPQTASEHDQNALMPMLDQLKESDLEPKIVLADAGYGGDDNYCSCIKRDINLIAPVLQGTLRKDRHELGDFQFDESNCVTTCPNGVAPIKAWFKPGQTGAATFSSKTCSACPLRGLCRAKEAGNGNRYLYYDARAFRTAQRKAQIAESETAALYAMRSGVESIYSAAKRTGLLDRLPVRGEKAVYLAICLRIAAINFGRAVKSDKIKKIVAERIRIGIQNAIFAPFFRPMPTSGRTIQPKARAAAIAA